MTESANHYKEPGQRGSGYGICPCCDKKGLLVEVHSQARDDFGRSPGPYWEIMKCRYCHVREKVRSIDVERDLNVHERRMAAIARMTDRTK